MLMLVCHAVVRSFERARVACVSISWGSVLVEMERISSRRLVWFGRRDRGRYRYEIPRVKSRESRADRCCPPGFQPSSQNPIPRPRCVSFSVHQPGRQDENKGKGEWRPGKREEQRRRVCKNKNENICSSVPVVIRRSIHTRLFSRLSQNIIPYPYTEAVPHTERRRPSRMGCDDLDVFLQSSCNPSLFVRGRNVYGFSFIRASK